MPRYFRHNNDVSISFEKIAYKAAGHLTIFVSRTRGSFWSKPRPANILLGAVLGTQTFATLIAVNGVFMAPIGQKWAFGVWAHALARFLVNNRL